MNRKTWLALGAALLLGLASFTSRAAQSAGAAVVSWWVMAGGGGPVSAANVSINGSIGQTVTGASASGDQKTTLGAGYWPSVWLAPTPVPGGKNHVFLPWVVR